MPRRRNAAALALVVMAGCSEGEGALVPGWAEPALAFTVVSALSPDLATAPFGGGNDWRATDMYAPGVALIDLDGDGVLDLVQPRNDRSDPARRPLRTYRGLGGGRFADATTVAWDPASNATAVVAFDYDRDDDLDLFVGVDGGPSVLYRNDGGFRFTDVAAVAGTALPGRRVLAAAAADLDRDGHVDLFVGLWNASALDHGPGTAGGVLLRNRGDGTFEDVTAAAGAGCQGRSVLGLAIADLDGDGDLDVFVANDYFPACLLENRGDGTFVDRAAEAGVLRGAWNGMGVAVGDLDGDGDLDLMVTDDEVADDSRGNAVYMNDGGLRFASRAIDLALDGLAALDYPSWLVCWGVGLVDLDLDGDLDVHVATHGGRSELVWQQQGGRFVAQGDLMAQLGDADARGSAYGDIDGDGDLDIIVGRRGAGLQVLRNDTRAGEFLAVAPRPYAAAPGAQVMVTAGGHAQVAVIQAGSSYQSTSPPVATFGLGATTEAERVEVRFADGARATREHVPAGQVIVLRHP